MRETKRKGTRGTWLGYVLAGLVLGSWAAGCGMFDIRPPSLPATAGCVPLRQTPSGSDAVLFNLSQAIRCQEDGLAQFEESLVEIFHLSLDLADRAEIGLPGVDSLSKTQTSEAQRLRSLESNADSFYFAFGRVEPERTDLTAFYRDTPYTLQVLVPEGDSLRISLEVVGKSDLSLAQLEAGKWAMTRWVDKRESPYLDPYISLGRWYAEKVGAQAPQVAP